MKRTLVLNVVGLTPGMLGSDTPNLLALAERGKAVPLRTIVPAVTCSVQSTFLTGALPREHGCVANGWLFRHLAQVWLWRQSNRLVGGEKVWEAARSRDARFTCAQLFWWYNMYADVEWSVTPRPIYRADGRKLPDIHTSPPPLRNVLHHKLGPFPLFNFWGPRADITSSQWIAHCAEHVYEREQPTLTLVYLPHLDYCLQRLGPDAPQIAAELRAIDAVCGPLIERARHDGTSVIVLSEYGVTPVQGPIHINRILREAGFITYREELEEEHLDAGASAAFAVADHQVAHIYVRRDRDIGAVKELLQSVSGIERVLDDAGKRELGLDHPRSGELIAIAQSDRWFTYYWWLQDSRAPDYARCVDIHSKPGYDPVELFVDPKLPLPKFYVATRLMRSKLFNQRALLDVIPLDATLVRGSHGRPTDRAEDGPIFITDQSARLTSGAVNATDVKGIILDHIFAS